MDNKATEMKWYHKAFVKAMWIHKDKTSRKRFTCCYCIFIGAIFLVYCISAIFFYFYGLRFNPDTDPNYNVNVYFQWALYVGLILFILDTLAAIGVGIFIIILYKESKRLYMQTDEYRAKLAFYQTEKLEKYSPKELKWVYKLGYIDRVTYRFYSHPEKK